MNASDGSWSKRLGRAERSRAWSRSTSCRPPIDSACIRKTYQNLVHARRPGSVGVLRSWWRGGGVQVPLDKDKAAYLGGDMGKRVGEVLDKAHAKGHWGGAHLWVSTRWSPLGLR